MQKKLKRLKKYLVLFSLLPTESLAVIYNLKFFLTISFLILLFYIYSSLLYTSFRLDSNSENSWLKQLILFLFSLNLFN